MNPSNSDTKHEYVRAVYEIGPNDVKSLDSFRNFINRQFENYAKEILKKDDAEWESLTNIEKEYFVYEYIKDDVLSDYLYHNYAGSPLEHKLMQFVQAKHFPSKNDLIEEIRFRDDYAERPEANSLSEYKLKKRYKQYCKELQTFRSDIKVPDFKDWKKDTVKVSSPISETLSGQAKKLQNGDYLVELTSTPASTDADGKSEIEVHRNAYDILMDIQAEDNEHFDLSETLYKDIFEQQLIQEILISTLEEKFHLIIDFEAIKETADFFFQNPDCNPFDVLTFSTNPELPIPLEEQEKIVARNLKYIYYKKKRDKLDFYHKDEFGYDLEVDDDSNE